VRLFELIDLRRRPAIRSRFCVRYFGFRGAPTTIGRIAHPPKGQQRMRLSLIRLLRSTSVAEGPTATPECMPSLGL
jgi:hypothetical protein